MKRLPLIFCVILTGCIGHMGALEKPPADWPKLKITEHKGVWTTLANCYDVVPLPILLFVGPPLGCAKVRLDKLTCDAYYMFDWVRQGEIEHCEGRDHAGEDTFSAGWAEYKDRVLGAAVAHGAIATW